MGGGSPARGGNRRSRKAFQGLCGGTAAVRAGALQGAASDRSPSTIPAPVAGASPAAHRFHPAEDLHPRADAQAHHIAGMARRAPIDGQVLLLCHMRRHPPLPHVLDTVLGCRSRDRPPACAAGSQTDREVHQQTVAVPVRAWPRNTILASLPGPLRSRHPSGVVMLACVSLLRRSPRKSTDGLPGSSSVVGGNGSSLGRKILGWPRPRSGSRPH